MGLFCFFSEGGHNQKLCVPFSLLRSSVGLGKGVLEQNPGGSAFCTLFVIYCSVRDQVEENFQRHRGGDEEKVSSVDNNVLLLPFLSLFVLKA